MEKNKEKVIKELRRVFCAPCTTANSCVGCLVDIAEEAVNASQHSVQADGACTCANRHIGEDHICVNCGGVA